MRGTSFFPFINIPSSPIFSLASFADANLTVGSMQPYRAVGNSWSNLFVSPTTPYGRLTGFPGHNNITASDTSWLINDALFDRYYLSGIAPDFTIGNGGYSASGSIPATLTSFFSANYQDANANPVLRPYLPNGTTAPAAVTALAENDGYKKMGAYSLIDGAFNVNSTSVKAWEALLRANRDLAVAYSGSGTNSAAGTPFPKGSSPAFNALATNHWSGFSRLNDTQIEDLADEIVNQVKLRGPFMSISDFVNHRVGTPMNNATHYMGALQAAIEAAGINQDVRTSTSDTAPVYTGVASRFFPNPPPNATRTTTTGIPGDITQTDLLLPLAPRLSARSDTFRIRAYGEARDASGTIIAKATCEAVVQRVPEYVDPTTNAADNEPWDEDTNPDFNTTNPNFNAINRTYGRRFVTVGFRWLTDSEI